MTHPQDDITIRSITGAEELDVFCALDYIFNDELADDLASGRRRPAWMWVAMRGEHLVARAAWWGSGDDAAPGLLDILDVASDPDRIDVGVRLLKGALSEIIPAGPARRSTAASSRQTGESTPAHSVLSRTGWRSSGRSERSSSPSGSASSGDRGHPSVLGFVVPARNNYHAIIAYLGVLPAHRGNGYINEILAEGTRILAVHNVPRIRASTDLGNVPMARAFARAGWINFQRSISMIWP